MIQRGKKDTGRNVVKVFQRWNDRHYAGVWPVVTYLLDHLQADWLSEATEKRWADTDTKADIHAE